MRRKKSKNIIMSTLFLIFLFYICSEYQDDIKLYINNLTNAINQKSQTQEATYTHDNIPKYDGQSFITLNNNIPNFTEEDYNTESFENYSELDSLGRCGTAFANIGIELMPTTKRESIGMIKPSGWHTIKYDIVNGKYLYNRCHLIGYQLTGENANPKNLITCTRSMNTIGMLDFENQVAEYIKEKKKNVLYRVTPIFQGNNLLADGVEIEASSVEDHCGEICFDVFVYNVQEGISINYENGQSELITND